jgi:tRNA-splicing ligase RtcB
MIHTGSRGFGFQVNKDFSEELKAHYEMWDMDPLVPFMPIRSDIGQRYFRAQSCAVNFAVASKTLITNAIYEAFAEVFGDTRENLGMRVLYDLMHNVARFEHDGHQSNLVIRKGATRALPAGHHMNPLVYRETGHPVLIPGSMGTYSYILVGQEGGKGNYYTVPHGAGRVMSRGQARKTLDPKAFEERMNTSDILVNTRQFKNVIDEAPMAYKDIDEIIASVEGSGRASVVARLRPVAVIKGAED